MLKRLWLGFTQVITALVMLGFIVWVLKPQWLPASWMRTMSGESAPAPVVASGATLAPRQAPRNMAGLSYHDAVASALPSVVNIDTSRAASKNPYTDPALSQLYNNGQQSQGVVSGSGSGVIVDAQGFIVTNYHVIENATQIDVSLGDGRKARATLVGFDVDTDIAVLKIDLEKLPAIAMADDKDLLVGDVVLAIGNPFGIGQTVTMGIVSGLNRNHLGISTFENYIQTDAAINHGNSGGALVNSNGYLVGINTAIYAGNSNTSDGNIGIGFAIPSTTVKAIADEIIKTGAVSRGYIGVASQNITPEMARTFNLKSQDGVIIATVRPEGPAGQAGVTVGDVLTQVNDAPIKDTASMLSEIAKLKPGTQAKVKLVRNGQAMELTMTIAKRPAAKSSK